MPYQDSNASRRNLLVTSLMFIAVGFGGGEVSGQGVKLPLLDVTFKNMNFLIAMAWVMLFWFAYRYWQKNQVGDKIIERITDMGESYNRRKVIEYVRQVTNKPHIDDEFKGDPSVFAFRILEGDGFGSVGGDFKVRYHLVPHKSHSSIHEPEYVPNVVTLNDPRGQKLIRKLKFRARIVAPEYTDYVVPYVFFITAIASGIYGWVV